jgi:hypothetical protein
MALLPPPDLVALEHGSGWLIADFKDLLYRQYWPVPGKSRGDFPSSLCVCDGNPYSARYVAIAKIGQIAALNGFAYTCRTCCDVSPIWSFFAWLNRTPMESPSQLRWFKFISQTLLARAIKFQQRIKKQCVNKNSTESIMYRLRASEPYIEKVSGILRMRELPMPMRHIAM